MRSVILAFALMLLAALGATTAWAQNGSIVAWGLDDHGQCEVPHSGSDLTATSAGEVHSLGLTSGGSIIAWGSNLQGQCNLPAENSGFAALSAGYEHSVGLKSNGSVVAWGLNNCGQCTPPALNSSLVTVSAGGYHNLALRSDSVVVAWGANHGDWGYGQCDVPQPNIGFVAITAGYLHSLALKADGVIVAWGLNNYGQCDVPEPNAGFVSIAAGCCHSLGLKSDGTVVAWGASEGSGWPYYGQCDVPSPNADFVSIAAGLYFSVGLRPDGSVVAWGDNRYGQRNVPSSTHLLAIACGGYHCLGVVEVSGACCQPDGTCTVASEIACPSPGLWQGGESVCDPNPCLSGACCLRADLNICEIHPSAQCALYNGIYQGNGALCDPNPCPALIGVDAATPLVSRLQVLTAPNPSTGGVVIRCLLPAPGLARLVLVDASGRIVRRLQDGPLPAGETPFSWDGRDDAGREIPAGVYLVKVTTPGVETSGRVVLTR